jgi:hypothetical protein
MKIKRIIYIMMILTGILIEKYGLQTDNVELEKYFGFGIISLGSFNIILDFLKNKKNGKKMDN